VWVTKTAKFEWIPRRNAHSTGSGLKTWIELEMRRTRLKRLVRAYVIQYAYGKVDWEQLGRVYRKNDTMRVIAAQRILQRPEVRQMVDDALAEELTKAGITKAYALGKLKKAMEVAEGPRTPRRWSMPTAK